MQSNAQFIERGVRESGYISLDQRNETNQSILAIARSKTLKEAFKKRREDIQLLVVAGASTPKGEN